MKRIALSLVVVLGLASLADAYYPLRYRHTYSAPAVNGYYMPPVLGGYNVYAPAYPAYGFGAPSYGMGAGSFNSYGGFGPYGAYGGVSGSGFGWGGAY